MRNTSILFFLFLIFSSSSFGQTNSESTPPYFRGCEDLPAESVEKKTCSDKALMRFIGNGLLYPEVAIENNVQGTVVVSFDITKEGKVEKTKVEHDIGANCGEAAIKIVKAMPKWQPAQENGKAVRTRMTLPVRFAFGEQKENPAEAYSLIWGDLRGGKISKKELKNTLNQAVMVRDPYGNSATINDLQINFEKGRKSITARSTNNKLTKKMKKLIKKSRRGGTIRLSAAVQKEAAFVVIEELIKVTQ